MPHTQGVSVPKTFNFPENNEPTTHEVLQTLLDDYALSRPHYWTMMEEFRKVADEYQRRRSNIDAAFEGRGHMSELRASRDLARVKEMAFQEFDTVFMRSACKTVKLPSSAALAK